VIIQSLKEITSIQSLKEITSSGAWRKARSTFDGAAWIFSRDFSWWFRVRM